jgi:ABC-2 type transport system permease protein
MRLKWKLTVASTKMFFRQKEAIVWTLLFPLFIVVLFGFVKFDGIGRMHLGVVNEAGANGAQLLGKLSGVKTFEIAEGPRDAEVAALGKGERDIVLVIPKGFTPGGAEALTAYADPEARPRETQLAVLVLQRVLDEDAFAAAPQVRRSIVSMEPVKTRNLTYMDFLLPGVLSMSIMQMGIFGVAFSFVSLKKRGILRRLWVTPINPSDFIFAQVATRLLTLMVQMTVMIGVGVLFLNLHFIGNFLVLYLLGILGAVVFLGIGFALAGISRSEDQVAPLANVITLPMMALSGIFFSRTNLPGFLRVLTDYFPLTYLADGVRSVAIDGATLSQVLPQVTGLAVWAVITCGIAVRLFHWE